MKIYAGQLVPGDLIISRKLGQVTIDSVHLLSSGEYEINYSRADKTGMGQVICTESSEFEIVRSGL